MTTDGLQNAGITAKERLERIEALLELVNEKLDLKASSSDLMALQARVAALENLTAPTVAARMKDLENVEIQVTNLRIFAAKVGLMAFLGSLIISPVVAYLLKVIVGV